MNDEQRGPGNPAWTKGGPSPNPGGRPSYAKVSEAIREILDDRGFRRTEKGWEFTAPETWGGELTGARVLALEMVQSALSGKSRTLKETLDRAEGKAFQAQSIDVSSFGLGEAIRDAEQAAQAELDARLKGDAPKSEA